MNNPLYNRSPFLQSQKDFSNNIERLTTEIFKAYVDIAQKVNQRIIGTYAINKPSLTGESWFVTSQRMQTQRQLYTITTATSYPHGIDLSQIVGFTRIYGTAYDGTNWYPLPYIDATSATDQIEVYVDGTNIVITAGGGTPPTITEGYVVLEWLVRTSSTEST